MGAGAACQAELARLNELTVVNEGCGAPVARRTWDRAAHEAH